MKKIIALILSFFIGAGLFLWILDKVGWQAIKDVFSAFSLWQGLIILLVTILTALIGTWRWKEILKSQGVDLSLKALLGPYLAGFSVMFLASIMVFAGEVFRAYSLKERNSVPWPKAMASVIIERVLEWTANITIILIGLLFFIFNIGLPPDNLAMIFGIVFLVFIAGIGYFYIKVYREESFVEIIMGVFTSKELKKDNAFLEIEREIFDFFKTNRAQMWKGFAISYFRAAVMFLRVWLLIFFLGKSAGFLAVLAILGFSYLASMTPIPTALGSHEALQAFSFNSLGLGIPTSTAFTMIIRGAELMISLVGLVILFRLGFIFINSAILKKIKNFEEKIRSKTWKK